MRLNLGCGRDIKPGWINVDAVPAPGVDHVTDLDCIQDFGHTFRDCLPVIDRLKYTGKPFGEAFVEEFMVSHLIEHLSNPLRFMDACWRAAKPGALMTIRVPHGSSDAAWEDQTHLRPYFAGSFDAFGQPYYARADYGYRGDWQVETIQLLVDAARHGRKTRAEALAMVDMARNTVLEMIVTLRAVKPARAQDASLARAAKVEVVAVGQGKSFVLKRRAAMPPIGPPDEHREDLAALEDLAWLRLRRILTKTRREVVARLIALVAEDRSQSFGAAHLTLMAAEMSQILGERIPEIAASLLQSTAQGLALGVQQAVAEVVANETAHGTEQLAEAVEQHVSDAAQAGEAAALAAELPAAAPRSIPVEAIKNVTDPQQSLVERFGGKLEQAAADSLGESFALGEGIKPAARRLGEQLDLKGWELERIARTEINHAANAAHLAQLVELNDAFPEMGMLKQWSAEVGDGRCCEDCAAMDGQVRKLDEDFEAPSGWRGPHPDCHPNGRCRVNGYTVRWAGHGKQPEYGMEGEEAMKYATISDLPAEVRARYSPAAQNDYRRVFNLTKSHRDAERAALAKDGTAAAPSGPTTGSVHTDVPLGAGRKPARRKKPAAFLKSDGPKRYTLGVVYEPDVEDTQGDVATAEEIENACWEFNRSYLGTGRPLAKGALGIQHESWDDSNGEIIESYIAPADMQVAGNTVTKGTWLMGTIWSPANWRKIQDGDLTGLSMGGRARRVEA